MPIVTKVLYLTLRLPGAIFRRIGAMISTQVWRLLAGNVGTGTIIQWGVQFREPNSVKIGSKCYIWSGVSASSDLPGGQLIISDGAQINMGVHLDMTGELYIGPNVLISEGAFIYTHDHGLDPRSVPTAYNKEIAEGAWIGMRSVVMPSCNRIGKGAVIGACAVVTKDVPDYAIVAGNPARVIGSCRVANLDA
ncbi:acyltransferase [Sulfitobacter sp. M220]|uniref:acyltransferase n=1 Tax=Sulfitobacter sp. M220 TaxID=2675333 RepID=UPI001FA5FCA1|nr:acyltransferase [Sulfitobacter sp. M220]MCF7779648.1 acyltransferase [Sulfitobacter sp. M220]